MVELTVPYGAREQIVGPSGPKKQKKTNKNKQKQIKGKIEKVK